MAGRRKRSKIPPYEPPLMHEPNHPYGIDDHVVCDGDETVMRVVGVVSDSESRSMTLTLVEAFPLEQRADVGPSWTRVEAEQVRMATEAEIDAARTAARHGGWTPSISVLR